MKPETLAQHLDERVADLDRVLDRGPPGSAAIRKGLDERDQLFECLVTGAVDDAAVDAAAGDDAPLAASRAFLFSSRSAAALRSCSCICRIWKLISSTRPLSCRTVSSSCWTLSSASTDCADAPTGMMANSAVAAMASMPAKSFFLIFPILTFRNHAPKQHVQLE